MRRQQRAYAGTHPTLEAALAAARRRLIAVELTAAIVPVVLATVIAADIADDIAKDLPFGVAVVACSVFAVDLGRVFVNGFRLPLAGTATSASQAEDERDSFASSAQEAVRRLLRRLGYLVAIVGVLKAVADVLDIWNIVEESASWLKDAIF
jgi:hypothetical protein